MCKIKLLALDEEDLQIISAHLQDAIVRVGDISFTKSDNKFAMLLSRFIWENIQNPSLEKKEAKRCCAALHFDNVRSVKTNSINLKAKAGMLELLAIIFEKTDYPSGKIILTFAGGGAICLEVETIEARLMDIGTSWTAKTIPTHEG